MKTIYSWKDNILWHGTVPLMRKWKARRVAAEEARFQATQQAFKAHVKMRRVAAEESRLQRNQQALEELLEVSGQICEGCEGLCMKCHTKRLRQGDLRHMLTGATETRNEEAKDEKAICKEMP